MAAVQGFGLAGDQGAQAIGAGFEHRATVEDVQVAAGLKAFPLQQLEVCLCLAVWLANSGLGGVTQQGYVDRVRRHEFGDEGSAELAGVLVCGFKVYVEEVPAEAVPEGYAAVFVLNALDFNHDALGEPAPVAGDEQPAGAGEQFEGGGFLQPGAQAERTQQAAVSQ